MKYVSIDIETTGLDPSTCQTIELGAVIDDLNDPRPVESLPTFQCYIEHEQYRGQPYALSMHPVAFKRIATKESGFDYYSPEAAVAAFENFLAQNIENYEDDQRINVAGKNFASFDWQFLKRLATWNDVMKIRHRVIDPSMLYWQPGDDRLPDTKLCMERAGLDGVVAHTAVEDAQVVCELIRRAWR